jgi:hypothetical protein
MSLDDIEYWTKVGVRVRTLCRLLGDLAFFCNDFIPIPFIENVSLIFFFFFFF